MNPTFRKDKFLIPLLFILALMPRIAAGIISGQVLSGDEVDYSQLAVRILEGRAYHSDFLLGFTNARPPLYPLFIAAVYFFTDNSILAVKLAQALLGAFICVIVFFVAEGIFKDKRISFGAALIYAVYPLSISVSGSLLSETLFTFLLALAIFFLLKGYDRPGLKNYLLSGVFLGLTALTRPVILAFLPFLILWLALFSSVKVMSRFKSMVFIMLFMALAIMPWTVRNYFVFKEFIPVSTGGSVTFYVYNNEITLAKIHDPLIFLGTTPLTDGQKKEISLLSEPQRDKYLYKLGWEFAKSHPKDFLEIRLISLGQFWHLWPETPARYKEYYSKEGACRSPLLDKLVDTHLLYFAKILYHLLYNILFIGMFIGLYISFKRGAEFRKSLLLIFLLIAMTLLCSIHGTDRYRIPTDPYVFILGVHGLLSFRKKK